MDKKQNKERPGERINQFIIECMFNKYFEEKEIASSLPSLACRDTLPGQAVAPRNDEVVHISQ